MAKLRIITAAILIAILTVLGFVAFFSETETFLLTNDLTVVSSYNGEYFSQLYSFNLSDSNKVVGNVFFTMYYILPGQFTNMVFIDIGHKENTELDKVIFTFTSPKLMSVSVDMGSPHGISYTSSRASPNTFTIIAYNFGELGTVQASLRFRFLFDDIISENDSSLSFSADIFMHYMIPLQLTALKGHVEIHTGIPQAN